MAIAALEGATYNLLVIIDEFAAKQCRKEFQN